MPARPAATCIATLLVTFSIPSDAEAQRAATVHQWAAASWRQSSDNLDLPVPPAADELPPFVHTRNAPETSSAMALEKSVAYFHMPLQQTGALALDITAEIRNGSITAWYPFARIPPEASSAVKWEQLKIGEQAEGPETESTEWRAPRLVAAAATLKVERSGAADTRPGDAGTTEGEVYLFYRGVANVKPPVRVARKRNQLLVTPGTASGSTATLSFRTPGVWLLETRSDGYTGFANLGELNSADSVLSSSLEIPPASYTKHGHEALGTQLREALNAAGLLDDEAGAMLKALDSFMKRPGKAVLFLLPEAWMDKALPFSVQGQAEVKIRTGLGRIQID